MRAPRGWWVAEVKSGTKAAAAPQIARLGIFRLQRILCERICSRAGFQSAMRASEGWWATKISSQEQAVRIPQIPRIGVLWMQQTLCETQRSRSGL